MYLKKSLTRKNEINYSSNKKKINIIFIKFIWKYKPLLKNNLKNCKMYKLLFN